MRWGGASIAGGAWVAGHTAVNLAEDAAAARAAATVGVNGSTGAATVVTSAEEVGVASVVKATGSNGSTGAAGSATSTATGTTVAAGELAGTADQVFPGVTKGSYNPTGLVVGQMEQASCAAGCTKMGAVPEIPESYIRGVIGTADGTGTNIANIPSGLQKLGYQGTATYTETATIGNVAQQTAAGNSVIVNVRTPGGDIHAIVVDSISNGTAYIRDPLPMGGSSGGSAHPITHKSPQ